MTSWANWIMMVAYNGGWIALALFVAFSVIYPIWSIYKEKLQASKYVSDGQICVLIALIGAKYALGIGALTVLVISIARVSALTTSAIL